MSLITLALVIVKFSVLNKILSQIRSLSIITHMMLIQIELPGIVMIFYSYILDIVKFDIMETVFAFDALVAWIFELPDEPVDEAAESLGYGSHFLITNMSALLVFFIILLCLYGMFRAFYELFSRVGCPEGRAMKFAKEWTDNFKWNGLI